MSYVAEVQQSGSVWKDVGDLTNLRTDQVFRAYFMDRRQKKTLVINDGQSVFRFVGSGTNDTGQKYAQGLSLDGRTNLFVYL